MLSLQSYVHCTPLKATAGGAKYPFIEHSQNYHQNCIRPIPVMFKKSFDNKTPLLVAFVADIRKNICIKFNPVLFNFQLPLYLLRTTAPEQKSRELWELSSKTYLDSYLIYLVFMFNFFKILSRTRITEWRYLECVASVRGLPFHRTHGTAPVSKC